MKKLLLVALAIAAPALLVGGAPGDVLFNLLFGWAGFLARVAPDVSLRWDGVVTFAAALVIFAGMLHGFLRWLYGAMRTHEQETGGAWKLRWTATLVALVVVMFWAGVSMIGVVHQTAWLGTSDEPVFGTALAARGDTSAMNLKIIGLGLQNYQDVYRSLPSSGAAKPPAPRHSWATHLLPFLNYDTEIDLTRPWDDPANAKHFRSVLPELINPDFRTAPVVDENGFGLIHYAGNSRVLESETWSGQMGDEDSTTLLVGEVNQQFVAWRDPSNSRDPSRGINTDPTGFGGSPGRRGALFVLADGSVRVIAEEIDPDVLRSLATPRDGESQPADPRER